MVGEWGFWELCAKLGLLAGFYHVVAKLLAYILESRRFPGTYCHLDDSKTYEEKGFKLTYGGLWKFICHPRSGSVRNKDGTPKKGTACWHSDLMRNRVEISSGECRIAVARIAPGVYEGYYMKGPPDCASRKVRLQKVAE